MAVIRTIDSRLSPSVDKNNHIAHILILLNVSMLITNSTKWVNIPV